MKAVLYLRVSTLHQKESKSGLKAQLKACKEKAMQLKIRDVYVFKDSGISGFTQIQERPGLSNALIILQPHDIFIVATRDRIARDTAVAAQVEQIIESKKALLISVAGEGTTLQGIQGLQERRMADVKSEVFRKLIIENTKASLQSKKHKGSRTGTIPYGLKLAKDGIGLEPCQKELIIIKQVTTLKLQGLSLRHITKEINALGHRGRTGQPFQLNQIVHMLEGNNQFIVAKEPYSKVRFLLYGYKLTEDGSNMVKCPKEQKVIALVKELQQQDYSLSAITNELNHRGYRSRVGTIFQPSQISRIIKKTSTAKANDAHARQTLKYGLKFALDGIAIEESRQEQEVIQQARMLRSQGLPLRSITRELNAKGFTGRTGRPFQLTQIVRILNRVALLLFPEKSSILTNKNSS